MIALFSLSLIALVLILALSINDAFTSESGCADGLATAPLARGKFYVMPKYHPESRVMELTEAEFAQAYRDELPYIDQYQHD